MGTTTILRATGTTTATGWVEASPFRAHLRHLMAAGGLSSTTVALLAGVSPGFAFRLLNGRRGRQLRRISPDLARQLLAVTADDVRAVRRRRVPAAATSQQLHRLRELGWTVEGLADELAISPEVLSGLLAGRTSSCSQLLALSAAALESTTIMPLPGWSGRSRTAA